jgi:hypothetical protein
MNSISFSATTIVAKGVEGSGEYDWLNFPFWAEATSMSTAKFMMWLQHAEPDHYGFLLQHLTTFLKVKAKIESEIRQVELAKVPVKQVYLGRAPSPVPSCRAPSPVPSCRAPSPAPSCRAPSPAPSCASGRRARVSQRVNQQKPAAKAVWR